MKPQELLTSLSLMSARTEAAERKILDAAVAREAEVIKRMGATRTDALLSPEAADEYQQLALERGHLSRVIGLAKERLGA